MKGAPGARPSRSRRRPAGAAGTGDPLQDITVTERVNWVMEGGKVVKDDRRMKPKS